MLSRASPSAWVIKLNSFLNPNGVTLRSTGCKIATPPGFRRAEIKARRVSPDAEQNQPSGLGLLCFSVHGLFKKKA